MPKKKSKPSMHPQACQYARLTGCGKVVVGATYCDACRVLYSELRRTISEVLKPKPVAYSPKVYTVIPDR